MHMKFWFSSLCAHCASFRTFDYPQSLVNVFSSRHGWHDCIYLFTPNIPKTYYLPREKWWHY